MKDKVTKTVRRVIKTADYETVEVVNSIEREIEYANDAEYATKVGALRTDAATQVADDLSMVCEKLGVSEKRVFVKSNRPMPDALR